MLKCHRLPLCDSWPSLTFPFLLLSCSVGHSTTVTIIIIPPITIASYYGRVATLVRLTVTIILAAAWFLRPVSSFLTKARTLPAGGAVPPAPTTTSRGRLSGVRTLVAMAESSSPLQSFLADRRAKVVEKKWPGRLHVVIGNEAADADTIVSSLCYSYLLDRTKGEEEDLLHVPLFPIERQDFPLRTETAMLFRMVGLPTCDMIFLDDGVDLSSFHDKGKLGLTLVDHNELSSTLHHLGEGVSEIVDHHKDLGSYPWVKGSQRVIAFAVENGSNDGKALVASACSLVVEKYLSEGPHLLDPTISKLLLGVILLDTVNLDPKARKVTSRDVAAVSALQKLLGLEGNEALTHLYHTLNDVKTDPTWWGSLSSYDALRYDYKRFSVKKNEGGKEVVYGMSSVLLPIEDLLSKPHVAESASRFFQERGLDVLIILSFVAKPSYRRSIAIYSADPAVGQALADLLESQPSDSQHLELSVQDPPSGFWVFEQGNIAASRKQVEPVFRSLLARL